MLNLPYSILSNDTDVSTATSGQIYPMLKEQEAEGNSITMALVDSNIYNTNTGDCADRYRVEINCHAKTAADAWTLHGFVRTALSSAKNDIAGYNLRSCQLIDIDMVNYDGGNSVVVTQEWEFDVSLA